MTEHEPSNGDPNSKLWEEIRDLRSELESLRKDFDAHLKDHVPTQKESLMKARQYAGGNPGLR